MLYLLTDLTPLDEGVPMFYRYNIMINQSPNVVSVNTAENSPCFIRLYSLPALSNLVDIIKRKLKSAESLLPILLSWSFPCYTINRISARTPTHTYIHVHVHTHSPSYPTHDRRKTLAN